MSRTATRDDRSTDAESTPAAKPPAPPPKLRRRPALVAAAIVAICLGALLAAWAWTATTNTHDVLVARATIERGSIIAADELARVSVSTDLALSPVAGSELEAIVGKRAAVDIAKGSLLTPESMTTELVPAEGQSVVGVALTPEQAPGLSFRPGDLVRVVLTPAQGEDPPAGPPEFSTAEVVSVRVVEATGQRVVDLLVPHAEATVLAARIASGNVALVVDSRER